jgi:preprotein translocase subunit SecB
MAENTKETVPAANGQPVGARFGLKHIYLKDASFESPDSPEVFRRDYNPQVNFNINSRSRKVDDNMFEVILRMTAELKQNEKTIFLIEIEQAGVFEIAGVPEEGMEQVLMINCPNILFPYGREAVDSLVVKGGFPPLALAPISFEQVYLQAKRSQAEKAKISAETDAN